jgi:membrane protein required for beta-lactamase induction
MMHFLRVVFNVLFWWYVVGVVFAAAYSILRAIELDLSRRAIDQRRGIR